MNKILIGVLVLILVGSGVYFVTVMQKNSTDTVMVKEEVVSSPQRLNRWRLERRNCCGRKRRG